MHLCTVSDSNSKRRIQDVTSIPFFRAHKTGGEMDHLQEVLKSGHYNDSKNYVEKCQRWLTEHLGSSQVLLTGSCTRALELSALLLKIKPGDEIIMPSFTFVSTANAFAIRGAVPVFVDIRPDTMNIDESLIAPAISTKTKAIVPMHYAGVSCDMEIITQIARDHNLTIVEDAAQCIGSSCDGSPVGSKGDFAAFSFHGTKNITCGEGGCLAIHKEKFVEQAEILRDKGTNRNQFFKGQIDKYTWIDIGSNFAMDQFRAAVLWSQLQSINKITTTRVELATYYLEKLSALANEDRITLPSSDSIYASNGHIFYIKTKDKSERTALIAHLKSKNIQAVFHYIPLHSSRAGKKHGRFSGTDHFTTKESERLLRLPLYPDLTKIDIERVVSEIYSFYKDSTR